jgi:hypothetical protein
MAQPLLFEGRREPLLPESNWPWERWYNDSGGSFHFLRFVLISRAILKYSSVLLTEILLSYGWRDFSVNRFIGKAS